MSCVVFTSNEQIVRSYYKLNHRIRGLLFHYKKNVILQLASIFCKSIQNHPDSVCENDVNNALNVYTLFDGLAYNTCGYFASCVVYSEPRRGEEKYEQ